MFSPYYAWARRRHATAPAEAHCAVNLSLYRRAPRAQRFGKHWAMTERGAAHLQRSGSRLQIGPSHLAWQDDGSLQVELDERSVPGLRRLRGRLRLQPLHHPGRVFALDPQGQHHWQPISPRARLQLDFDDPELQWQGDAYLDANHGSRPLAQDFASWQWLRRALPQQHSSVHYEVHTRDGGSQALALRFDAEGALHAEPLAPDQPLPSTRWGLSRSVRGVQPAALLATLESGPFYARSLLQLDGQGGQLAVHESLSLRRFEQPWVQALLPFRMPRRPGWMDPR